MRARCGKCDNCKIVEDLKHQVLHDITAREVRFRESGVVPTQEDQDYTVSEWNRVLAENPCEAQQ